MHGRSRKLIITIPGLIAACMLASTASVSAATRTASVRPATITAEACYSGNQTWVHFYILSGNTLYEDQCVGGQGSIGLDEGYFYAFCAGNNYGSLTSSVNNLSFSPGFGWQWASNNPAIVYQVSISRWSGSNRCPSTAPYGSAVRAGTGKMLVIHPEARSSS